MSKLTKQNFESNFFDACADEVPLIYSARLFADSLMMAPCCVGALLKQSHTIIVKKLLMNTICLKAPDNGAPITACL